MDAWHTRSHRAAQCVARSASLTETGNQANRAALHHLVPAQQTATRIHMPGRLHMRTFLYSSMRSVLPRTLPRPRTRPPPCAVDDVPEILIPLFKTLSPTVNVVPDPSFISISSIWDR